MKRRIGILLLCLIPALMLKAQTAPSARSGGLPIRVGAGISDMNLDFGAGRTMMGADVWVDWDLSGRRFIPKGLSLEVEGRSVRWGIPAGFSQMKQETALGGVQYSYRKFENVRPYAKLLAGIGSIDFPPYGTYGHDTRDVYAPGGGLEVRAYKQIWVRADYEQQYWMKIFGNDNLTPHGVTFGVLYDFKRVTKFK
jgi:hypothetical protein